MAWSAGASQGRLSITVKVVSKPDQEPANEKFSRERQYFKYGNSAKDRGSLEAVWPSNRRFCWSTGPDSILFYVVHAVWIGCAHF